MEIHLLIDIGSPGNLKASIDSIIAALGPNKKLDLFEPARVDPKCTIEDTVAALAGFVKEGIIGYIGLSETAAATVRRAHAVHPIAAVEIEISPFVYEDEAKAVVEATKELGIAVVAYSYVETVLLCQLLF